MAEVIPLTLEDARDAVRRATQRIAPCHGNGEQLRDAMIWASIIRRVSVQVRPKRVAFVTNDAEFITRNGQAVEFNATLRRETDEIGIPFEVYPTIGALLEHEGVSQSDLATVSGALLPVEGGYLETTQPWNPVVFELCGPGFILSNTRGIGSDGPYCPALNGPHSPLRPLDPSLHVGSGALVGGTAVIAGRKHTGVYFLGTLAFNATPVALPFYTGQAVPSVSSSFELEGWIEGYEKNVHIESGGPPLFSLRLMGRGRVAVELHPPIPMIDGMPHVYDVRQLRFTFDDPPKYPSAIPADSAKKARAHR